MAEHKKYSYGKAWKETLRAWKIYYKERPAIFYALAAYTFTAAVSPYVTIWFSAQLINELAGGRNVRVLTELAAAALLSTAVMALLRAAAHRWRNCELGSVYQQENAIYMKKFLDMDFVDVDSQRVRELFSEVWQNRKLSGRGLPKSMYLLEDLIMAVFQILGGIGLSVGLFLLPVPENSSAAVVKSSFQWRASFSGHACSSSYFF